MSVCQDCQDRKSTPGGITQKAVPVSPLITRMASLMALLTTVSCFCSIPMFSPSLIPLSI